MSCSSKFEADKNEGNTRVVWVTVQFLVALSTIITDHYPRAISKACIVTCTVCRWSVSKNFRVIEQIDIYHSIHTLPDEWHLLSREGFVSVLSSYKTTVVSVLCERSCDPCLAALVSPHLFRGHFEPVGWSPRFPSPTPDSLGLSILPMDPLSAYHVGKKSPTGCQTCIPLGLLPFQSHSVSILGYQATLVVWQLPASLLFASSVSGPSSSGFSSLAVPCRLNVIIPTSFRSQLSSGSSSLNHRYRNKRAEPDPRPTTCAICHLTRWFCCSSDLHQVGENAWKLCRGHIHMYQPLQTRACSVKLSKVR